MYVWAYVCATVHVRRSTDNLQELVLLFTMWVLGTELRTSGLPIHLTIPCLCVLYVCIVYVCVCTEAMHLYTCDDQRRT